VVCVAIARELAGFIWDVVCQEMARRPAQGPHRHEILLVSLMAEGQERVAYLPGALDHLDQILEELARQAQALRQEEESVEEIEVGLPSAKGLERVEAG
jgi:hypothetical protein